MFIELACICMFLWFISLTTGDHLCRLCSISVEDNCELEISKDVTESNCGPFEGTPAFDCRS
jgi:hypothetical protein